MESQIGSIFSGDNDVVVDVGKDLVSTLGHEVSDGVGEHLERRPPVDPAEHDRPIQEVLPLSFYAKLDGIGWVYPSISESP